MGRIARVLLAVVFAIVATGVAEAQRRPVTRTPQARPAVRVPTTGSSAWGAGFGLAAPTDGLLDNGLTPNGFYEYYFTPRASLRFQGGAAWTSFSEPRFGKRARPVFFDVNGVYNWEGGKLHPFVTGGFGLYRYHLSEPPFEGSTTQPGINVGGGLEYFVTSRDAVKGELVYHGVAGPAIGQFASVNTSFWSATVGVKRYF